MQLTVAHHLRLDSGFTDHFLTNISMISLQTFDLTITFAGCRDAFGSGDGCRHGGDIGNLVFNRRFTDIGIINGAEFAARCIDHQLHFVVGNRIDNVGSALMTFKNNIRFNTVIDQKLMGFLWSL